MASISFEKEATKGLVSVVIPTYRGERFIGEALASINCQTYTNWEVIVVEDGSRGDTEKIVKDFARKHRWHRVDYSRNDQNCGPSHTRNTAFPKVRGEWVALLDADDRWFPDYLNVSTQALKASGKDVVYSSVVMIEDTSDLLLGTWGPDARDLADFPHGLFLRNFITPSASVLRREVLADVGTWNTQLRYCEDLDFWMRCVAAGKTFHYVGGCHCLYRRNHAEAATNKMCAVQEAHAQVAEQYILLPGTREGTCRKFLSQAYLRTAEFHANGNPLYDTSADSSRTAQADVARLAISPQACRLPVEGMPAQRGQPVPPPKPPGFDPDAGPFRRGQFADPGRGIAVLSACAMHRSKCRCASGANYARTNADHEVEIVSQFGPRRRRGERDGRRLRYAIGGDHTLRARPARLQPTDAIVHS